MSSIWSPTFGIQTLGSEAHRGSPSFGGGVICWVAREPFSFLLLRPLRRCSHCIAVADVSARVGGAGAAVTESCRIAGHRLHQERAASAFSSLRLGSSRMLARNDAVLVSAACIAYEPIFSILVFLFSFNTSTTADIFLVFSI